MKPIRIGKISNYCGGLWTIQQDDKFYWLIENYDYDPSYSGFLIEEWEEISEDLYKELLTHNIK